MLTLTEVESVKGESGNFTVDLVRHPRYVDMEKCIACGLCAEKCPKKVTNEYEAGLNKRKAAFVQYAQAVPLKYALDADQCIYLTRGKCKACEKFCPADAIFFEDQAQHLSLEVGALILAAGSQAFDPRTYDTYGYSKSENIVTSLEFERILSASGPYGGHLVRPSDKSEPRKIAWLQCVGSRDTHIGARGYCSGVCCTYAVKEAILAKEHSTNGLDAAIFYIDIRTFGKEFEQFYKKAERELGVRFIKSRISHVEPMNDNGMHQVRYVDGAGKYITDDFDIIVLSVGLGVGDQAVELANKLEVELNHYNFAQTGDLDPVRSSRPGIFVCGAYQGPKDIPTSVIDASAAAGRVGSLLCDVRGTQTKTKELPEPVDIKGEPPRVGVFVCCCGTNIAGFVDVPAVVEFAKTLPNVAYAEQNLFSCSQDTQGQISQIIEAHRLNRVVVSACTPKTHEALFQETLINGGLNKYLFEMANIRNQCSWVHKDDTEAATRKAKELVRMAVAKVALYEPLQEPVMKINQAALIIGGGVAGMTAARTLSQQGYRTHLIEKSSELGGQARYINETWQGAPVEPFLQDLVKNVQADDLIELHLNATVEHVNGFIGNFKTTIQNGSQSVVLEHGVTLIASGAAELKPDNFLYGRDPRVLTGQELKHKLADRSALQACRTAVFVQCVGSRNDERPWCSKVCCTQSIKSALELLSIQDDRTVYVLYRDLRAYGLREDLYRHARERGIKFVRYDNEHGIAVDTGENRLNIRFRDRVLRREMAIQSDLLVLASAIVPQKRNPLAQFYKVPQTADGFFAEAHVKLRPNDFATDGVFVCGLAHAPKPIDESIAQAQAAAARAVTVLSALEISVSGTVARVDPNLCSQCGVCVAVCPYSAPKFNDNSGKAEVQATLCKGCGLCTASCRSGAIHLMGFDTAQIMAQLTSCMWDEAPFETTFS